MQSADRDSREGMVPWEPTRALAPAHPDEVFYSRGFLRCHPERWFPGFSGHWTPLAHSLGVDIKLVEAKPLMSYPSESRHGFVGTVDDERVAMLIDELSARNLLEAVSPGASETARGVLLEYLARRLLATLGLCWSGPESSVVKYEPEVDPFAVHGIGAVKFVAQINGKLVTVWLALGRVLLNRLDGLWRRQIQSSGRPGEGSTEVQLEVTQLAVPPSMLVDYVRSGTSVDLEVPVSDVVALRVRGKPWLAARLRAVRDRLAFEIVAGPAPGHAMPEGSTRLSICLGSCTLDSTTLAEVSQPGAIVETAIPLSNRALMLINNEKVGEAQLCIYEGRFALSVL